jgi:hypothetical protein
MSQIMGSPLLIEDSRARAKREAAKRKLVDLI